MNGFKIKFGKKEIVAILLCVSFFFSATRSADAFLGINFSITLKDIERKVSQAWEQGKKVFFERLKKRMLTQIQNDLVNSIQNGGKPRFITHFGDFLTGSADTAAVKALDNVFGKDGIDICSPFKENVELLVKPAVYARDRDARCSLEDIWDNLEEGYDNFKNDFQNGGWTAWIKLNETNNTLPGAYFGALQLVGADVQRQGNSATAQISAGGGFGDKKMCKKYSVIAYKGRYTGDLIYENEYLGFTQSVNESGNISGLTENGTQATYSNFFDLFTEVVNNGITERVELSVPQGIDSSKISQNWIWDAKCIEEEIVTPGRVLADFTSGILQKTGVDSIINAQDIAQILDAVIDAYVNKTLKDGLSKIKTKKGSWTSPNNPDRDKTNIQTQVVGLEGPDAVELLRKIASLRTNAQDLVNLSEKFYGKGDRLPKFEARLDYVKNHPTFFEKLRGEGEAANDYADKAFDLIYGLTRYYEGHPEGESYPSSHSVSFNNENANPGVYLANKILHEKLAEGWRKLQETLESLKRNLDLPEMKNKLCGDIRFAERYTLEELEDKSVMYLPFTMAGGYPADWVADSKDPYYSIAKYGAKVVASDFSIAYIPQAIEIARMLQSQNDQIAKGYQGLIDNVKNSEEQFQSDIDYANKWNPKISDYASILSDYDTAGRGTNSGGNTIDLVGKTRNYIQALNKNETDLIIAYNELRRAQQDARTLWLRTQETIAESQDPLVSGDEKVMARKKIGIISIAIGKIINSLNVIDESQVESDSGETIRSYTQLGTPVSEAVAEALDFDKSGLTLEIESREVDISKQKSELLNLLGKFPNEKLERRRMGAEGGDSEWEKYFKNRFDYISVNMFIDFYSNRFTNYCR